MPRTHSQAERASSLAKAGRWREASDTFAQLLQQGKTSYQTHHDYAAVLMRCERHEAAREQLTAALRLRPDSLETLNNLAAVHSKLGQVCAAERVCLQILAREPDHLAALSNLGSALCLQARTAEGLEAFQRALELAPDDRIVRDNLLLNLNYFATDGQELSDIHHMLCASIASAPGRSLPDTKGRRIRVGYVSSDFRSHPVSFFMAGVFLAHDRESFEIFCYSTAHVPDGRTENFRQLAEHFRDLSTASDTDAARLIETDQLDILVDLGGHTAGNPLGILAHRPAPVQVSYLGYPATTGCSFIDYRLVDELTDPGGSDGFASERLVRLPAPFLCYYPQATTPAITPLPAMTKGHITFGSFNHSAKLSDDSLDLWSQVLMGVPDSRLFIKARALSDAHLCDQMRIRFRERGIAPERLTFSGILKSAQDHLAAYGSVDVALDTFPYNGTTTTCEALWMGVPVLSLVGGLHAARVGLTLLHAVGLGHLVATSDAEYVAHAQALAEDLPGLAGLRAGLRSQVAHSPLCDYSRLGRGLEAAFRQMLIPG